MRLIDADELKEEFKERYMEAVKWKNTTLYFKEKAEGKIAAYLEAIRTLNNAPTIDAVPVVRCKDCVHFAMFKDSVEKAGICKIGYGYCIENNFCSYGVRKDDSN